MMLRLSKSGRLDHEAVKVNGKWHAALSCSGMHRIALAVGHAVLSCDARDWRYEERGTGPQSRDELCDKCSQWFEKVDTK